MMALSRTLFEEVDFDQAMVNSNDWFSYPIMEMEHIPEEIDIHLISDPAEQNPFGAGKSSTRIVPVPWPMPSSMPRACACGKFR